MIKTNENLVLNVEGARILNGTFRNFAGEPDKFNPQGGARYFHFEIEDEEVANKLREDGWNVKTWASREEDIEPTYYLRVKIGRYVQFVRMVSGKNVVDLIDDRAPEGVDPQEGLGVLDKADIQAADLVITPRRWDDGITAYLKSGYFIIEEDPFAYKYMTSNNRGEEEVPF